MSEELTVLPASVEAETGFLSCLLMEPERIADWSHAPEDWFLSSTRRRLWRIMKARDARNDPMDLTILCADLRSSEDLTECGGIAEITAIFTFASAASQVDHWAGVLRDSHLKRELASLSDDLKVSVTTPGADLSGVLGRFEARLLSIGDNEQGENNEHVIGDRVMSAVEQIEAQYANRGKTIGIPTSLTDLDRLTGGFRPSQMITIGARPGHGKTALGMQFALQAAGLANPGGSVCDSPVPVGFFSLEMSTEELIQRAISYVADIDSEKLRDGYLNQSDFRRITLAAQKIHSAPIHIDDTGGLSIDQIHSKARRMVRRHGCRIIIIDYLQLVRPTRVRDNDASNIAEVSNRIKQMAKEFRCPVIAMAQLNREVAKGEKRRPRMSDLKGSGAIEQDSDLIILINQDEIDGQRNEDNNSELIIGKQRGGRVGDVIECTFLGRFSRFERRAWAG